MILSSKASILTCPNKRFDVANTLLISINGLDYIKQYIN